MRSIATMESGCSTACPFCCRGADPLRQGRLAVLVPPLADWQRRTLELLGVPASAVIEAPEPSVLCDDVIVPGLNVGC